MAMDSSLQARLFPGLAIKIQRSNGLIHSANVRTVNLEKSCVSVEWAEGGATKGKEIDFDDVAAINPELLQLLPLHPKDNLPLQENVTIQKQKRRSVNSKIPAPKESLRTRSTRMSTVSELRVTAQENDMEVELPAAANTRKQFSVPLRRKSCIVKEVEKMKNKREEKKAQNSEMRMKRAQEYDSSFPNWEFARMIKEFRATLECHPLTMTDPIEEHRICVCVRKRPLNKQELAKKEIDVISIPSKCLLLVHEPKLKVDLTKYLENQAFCFDFAFDETASNEVVYRFTARPLVQTIFEGGKATCFAYGQTGSGKTHTMGGDLSGKAQNASKGIYAMASRDVFLLKNQPCYRKLGLEVYVTFFEIYNGKLFDLLNKKAKLRVLEDGKQQVQVVGLQEHLVNSADDVIKMIDMGSACRTSGQTFANSNSSRSHACFQILLRAKGRMHGKFSLVDLAGNERGADTSSADRQTRMEGAEINKSLLALKECIRALGQNKAHTPFRESKLTQVLRDSFIGENSRTCMIATISPGISSCEYTLNTLRYADRVKELSPHSGPSGEQLIQMETEEMEACSNGALIPGNLSKEEEELSSQMSSFNEAMTQIRELEERAVEELKEIIQQGPDWLELSEMTEQPDYDLETFVNKAEFALAQQAKHFSALRDVIKALRLAMQLEEQASRQISSKKRPQ
ncbi:kinesin-like protein KIF2C isoform X2 [Macaca thibetana thibetana]|uniref:kinesin-like protein KIF2C isoform X2 n=1 Tax=Mandrillus leucophaeus TaxID=9568 RepID=UPI0003AB9599|nr:PREDICTED: kinesin-like protein KIF2C isoform X2 [Mandrillus leucophaeus]XP_014993545.1 kinesin-like protein KIF2C isoform X2 [Macaca mulatta]XP_045228309.1 kinesin-like protein KIF2C isoform X4 [Macaca fascicularis]XP_050654249.1 kinesin-like protein KIF2C isoform X2 [Macaca thibetana thibetana]